MTRLALSDFRNFAEAEICPFPDGLTVLRGENGAGKTSVLEALGYCSVLKSFRGVQRESLIHQGAERAKVSCQLLQGSRRVEIEVDISFGRRDLATLNSQRVSGQRELVEVLRTTLFTPDDLDLIKGAPAGRRDLLDEAVLVTSPRLGAERNAFERALRQRNALLRQLGGRLSDDATITLEIWDERLSTAGEAVVAARQGLVEAIGPYVAEAWSALSPSPGPLQLRYLGSYDGSLSEALLRSRAEDLRRQITTVGPQRDELELSAGGLDARTRLSQGRQRCAALSLRLGIHRYVSETTGALPILLLDDAFSELDSRTAQALVSELPRGQALLTTAGQLPAGASPDLEIKLAQGKVVT